MKPPEDTATIERDLHAVDAALAGGAARHDDPVARELQELALALRADAPVPEPAFAQDLRGRVEAGFPGEQEAPPPAAEACPGGRGAGAVALGRRAGVRRGRPVAGRRRQQRQRRSGGSSVAEAPSAGGDSGGRAEAAPDAPAASATDALSQPPTVPGTGFAPGRRERRIERSISMTLMAPDDEIPQAADDVNRVTARHGGFVLRSELDTGDGGSTGSFELRIPSGRLQGALRDLAKIATVGSQSQTGQDVTRDYVTATDRLQAARAERRSLLRRLEEADTDAEAEALRARLDLVAGEINGLRGQLRDLRLRTEYAIVSVDLIGDEDSDSGSGGGGAFDDAVGDAGDLLVGFAGVLIRVLAIALPLGLIALIAWLAGSGLRRRRRESALA